MTSAELEKWLESNESKSVGDTGGEGSECTGHASGRRIVNLLRTKQDDYSASDLDHTRKGVGHIHRHLAQRPPGDVTHTPSRYFLMNWGHNPAGWLGRLDLQACAAMMANKLRQSWA